MTPTWTLILLFYANSMDGRTAAVPGFSSQQTCVGSGQNLREMTKRAEHRVDAFLCVEVK